MNTENDLRITNNAQHYNIQQNDRQFNDKKVVEMLCVALFVSMPNVAMLSVVIFISMLNVAMLSVVAPF